MEEIIRRARGSTRTIAFTIMKGDTPLSLSGATVTMYLIDAQHWQGRDYDAPYSRFNRISSTSPSAIKVNGASCTPDADQSANPGLCEWTPSATDLDTAGTYVMQPWIVFADNEEDAPEPIWLEVFASIKALAS